MIAKKANPDFTSCRKSSEKDVDRAVITYGWNRVAYIINRSLSSKGIKTYIGDASKFTMGAFSKYTYKYFTYPSFYKNPQEFLEFIIHFCKKEGIGFLFPTHEETFIFSKYRDKLAKNKIKALLPDFDSLRIAHKKDESNKLAEMLDIPTPKTIYPGSIDDVRDFYQELNGNIVVKFINTNSAKGVYYPQSFEEICRFKEQLGNFIVQEKISGVGYGVSMLFNKGKLRAKFVHRRIQEKVPTGGTSVLRESTQNPLLEEYAHRILSHLQWNGVAMVEFKYDERNKKGWFIEINPRYWGSLALSYIAGIDFPYLAFRILKEGDVKPVLNYRSGVKVKWILGGVIGFLSFLKQKKINIGVLISRADGYDDFWGDDPLVFWGEVLYYSGKFLKTFQLNPTKESFLNIDEI